VFADLDQRTDAAQSQDRHPAEAANGGGADEPEDIDSDEDAVFAGTLRSPWKWEELIVESAVVGGRSRQDGGARWRRRLDGLSARYEYPSGGAQGGGGAGAPQARRAGARLRIPDRRAREGRARIATHCPVRSGPAESVPPPP